MTCSILNCDCVVHSNYFVLHSLNVQTLNMYLMVPSLINRSHVFKVAIWNYYDVVSYIFQSFIAYEMPKNCIRNF